MQPHDDHRRLSGARTVSGSIFQLALAVFVFGHPQAQVLTRDLQTRRPTCAGNVFIGREVFERGSRRYKRALAVLDDANLVCTADFLAFLPDRDDLPFVASARADVLAADLRAVQIDFERVVG